MASIEEIVADYVAKMRPMSEDVVTRLNAWASLQCPAEQVPELADHVHKFAGSAGSTGFASLSMIATLLELALRAVEDQKDLCEMSVAQITLLIQDFAKASAALCVHESALVNGNEEGVFQPFNEVGHVLLVALPKVIEAVLVFVFEQRLSMPLSLPACDMLETIIPERAPKLAVVSEPVPDYSFPILVYSPMPFEELACGHFSNV